MVALLSNGIVTDLAVNMRPGSNKAIFQQITRQLVQHYPVSLDTRRFTEVTIDGPGWTYTNDHLERFALRLTAGRWAAFDGFGLSRIKLDAIGWLYVPFATSFYVTSGASEGDYPCTFVVAEMTAK